MRKNVFPKEMMQQYPDRQYAPPLLKVYYSLLSSTTANVRKLK